MIAIFGPINGNTVTGFGLSPGQGACLVAARRQLFGQGRQSSRCRRAEQCAMGNAMRLACVAASLPSQTVGAQAGMPAREALEKALLA